MKTALTELNKMYNRQQDIANEKIELDTMISEIESTLRKSIVVTEKRGSKILTREDGLAIHITKPNARHYEKTVSWYNGVKGDTISSNDRGSVNSWRLWLARQGEK